MATAVIDVLHRESNALGVARAWIDCGLAIPLAWVQIAEGGQWELIDPDPEKPSDLTEMGEILNHLGARTDLHVVVLGDSTSADDPTVLAAVDQLLARIGRDFGPKRPPMHLMLAVRAAHPAEALGAYPEALVRLREWDGVLIVAPEDSPDPGLGNELGERPLDSLVAHSLFGLCDAWRIDLGERPTRRPSEGLGESKGRFVRSWSRIVDAGFVVDQLAEEMIRLPADSLEPEESRVTSVLNEILGMDSVREDLKVPPPAVPQVEMNGLRTLIRVIGFIIRRAPRELWRLITMWIRRWIFSYIRRFVRWALGVLGIGQREPLVPLDPIVEPPPPSDPVSVARRTLAALAAGEELEDPPSSGSSVLEAVTAHVIKAIDERRVSIVEAVGVESGRDPTTVMGRLIAAYAGPATRARSQVEGVIERYLQALGIEENEENEETGADPSADASGLPSDPGEPQEEKRPRRWWRWIRRLVRLVALLALVAMVVVGLMIPALSFLIFIPIAIVAIRCAQLLLRFIRHMAKLYERENGILDSSEVYERQLNHLVGLCKRHTYRVAQLQRWTRIMRAATEGVAAGAELPLLEQRPFTPVYAPRSMSIATGVANRGELAHLARTIRASVKGVGIYQAVWEQLMSRRREAFDDRRRNPRHGTTAELLEMDVRGLPVDVRARGREILTSLLADVRPDEVIEGVVPWVRHREPHGVERLDARPDVVPPGPAGRAISTTVVELGIHTIEHCLAVVGTKEGGPAAVAAVLAGEARIVVTAASVAGASTTWTVNDAPVEEAIAEGELVALRSDTETDGVPLGGLGTVRLGRNLLAPVVDSGSLVPRRCTISAVNDDNFLLDSDLPVGTPLIDALGGSLLGIVVEENPTRAAGPVALQRLLNTVASHLAEPDEDELDTGLWIPVDVLIGGTGVASELPAAEEQQQVAMAASSFLEGLTVKAPSFLPMLTDDSMILEVGTDVISPADAGNSALKSWLVKDGRLLFAVHRIQMSEEFLVSELYGTSTSGTAAPVDHGEGL